MKKEEKIEVLTKIIDAIEPAIYAIDGGLERSTNDRDFNFCDRLTRFYNTLSYVMQDASDDLANLGYYSY